MTPEWLSASSEALGVVVATIGILAVWRTLRNTQEQNKNSIYQLVTDRMSKITDKFLEYPDVRPYFYENESLDGHPGITPDLVARVKVMCEMLFDHAEVVLAQPKVMGPLGESYQAYFCDIVENSPAMRSYWRKRREWYIAPLQQIFDAAVAKSDRG